MVRMFTLRKWLSNSALPRSIIFSSGWTFSLSPSQECSIYILTPRQFSWSRAKYSPQPIITEWRNGLYQRCISYLSIQMIWTAQLGSQSKLNIRCDRRPLENPKFCSAVTFFILLFPLHPVKYNYLEVVFNIVGDPRDAICHGMNQMLWLTEERPITSATYS